MFKFIKVFIITFCLTLLFSTTSLAAGQNDKLPLTEIYTMNKDSIVSIYAYYYNPITRENKTSSGTGFIYNDKGYIITAGHIFKDTSPDAQIIVKTIVDQTEHPAKLVFYDCIDKHKLTIHDVALLKIDIKEAYDSVIFGNSDLIKTGEGVSTIGNPFGLELTMSSGIISKTRLPEELHELGSIENKFLDGEIMQTTVPIAPGSSGGPLLNSKGEVIGMIQALDTRAPWISWVIPINDVIELIKNNIQDTKQNTNA